MLKISFRNNFVRLLTAIVLQLYIIRKGVAKYDFPVMNIKRDVSWPNVQTVELKSLTP